MNIELPVEAFTELMELTPLLGGERAIWIEEDHGLRLFIHSTERDTRYELSSVWDDDELRWDVHKVEEWSEKSEWKRKNVTALGQPHRGYKHFDDALEVLIEGVEEDHQ